MSIRRQDSARNPLAGVNQFCHPNTTPRDDWKNSLPNATEHAIFDELLAALGVSETEHVHALRALWKASESGRNSDVGMDQICRAAHWSERTLRMHFGPALAALRWPIMRTVQRGGKYIGVTRYDLAPMAEAVARMRAERPASARVCAPLARTVLRDMLGPDVDLVPVPVPVPEPAGADDPETGARVRARRRTFGERIAERIGERGTGTFVRDVAPALDLETLAELTAMIVQEARERGALDRANEIACRHEEINTVGVSSETERVNRQILPVDPVPVDPPSDLLTLPNWVCWKYGAERPNGAREKLPYDPATDFPARVNDPATWTSYTRARAALDRGEYDGIGFVLTRAAGLVVVDLDRVRDPDTGDLADDAARIAGRLDSFTEVSPSGRGIHVWARGELPANGRRRGQVEMYDGARFICYTGRLVAGSPSEILERAHELHELHRETFGDEPAPTSPADAPPVFTSLSMTDDEVIERAQRAAKGPRFAALLAGDTDPYPSRSEAVMAFLGVLTFYTQDTAQLDRIMRGSGLFTPKWDERRRGSTWGAQQVARAVANRTGTYRGKRS